jgi:hypothetical protein
MYKGAASHHNRSPLHSDTTEATAFRTGLLDAQQPALLGGRLFEGSRCQPAGGGHSHVFHLAQIDIQPRPVVPEGLPYDNFSPVLRESGDLFQILGG